jgi:hypothetical protein
MQASHCTSNGTHTSIGRLRTVPAGPSSRGTLKTKPVALLLYRVEHTGLLPYKEECTAMELYKEECTAYFLMF